MVTGNCLSEIGYFRLHINTRNVVESITCCSKKVYTNVKVYYHNLFESLFIMLYFLEFRNRSLDHFVWKTRQYVKRS